LFSFPSGSIFDAKHQSSNKRAESKTKHEVFVFFPE